MARERAPSRPGVLGMLVVTLALIAPLGSGLFRVWVNRNTVQIGYELSEETRRRERLREQLERLELELAAQKSPARLNRLAKQLGLAPPPAQSVFAGGVP